MSVRQRDTGKIYPKFSLLYDRFYCSTLSAVTYLVIWVEMTWIKWLFHDVLFHVPVTLHGLQFWIGLIEKYYCGWLLCHLNLPPVKYCRIFSFTDFKETARPVQQWLWIEKYKMHKTLLDEAWNNTFQFISLLFKNTLMWTASRGLPRSSK